MNLTVVSRLKADGSLSQSAGFRQTWTLCQPEDGGRGGMKHAGSTVSGAPSGGGFFAPNPAMPRHMTKAK